MARMMLILSWVLAPGALAASRLNVNDMSGMNSTCARERDEGSWLQVGKSRKLSAKLSAELTAADRAASALAERQNFTVKAREFT